LGSSACDFHEQPAVEINNPVPRKRLGRDICLQETAVILRAMQSEYSRLESVAKRLKCENAMQSGVTTCFSSNASTSLK